MLTSWNSFLAKHGIWLRPNHGDTGCQTHLLTPSPVEHTCRSHSHQIHCVDFFISLSDLGCMVTPCFPKNQCSFLALCSYFVGPPTPILQIFRLLTFQSIIYRLWTIRRDVQLEAQSLSPHPGPRARNSISHQTPRLFQGSLLGSQAALY